MEEYDLIKEQLEPCGIVLIDTRKSDFLYCTSVRLIQRMDMCIFQKVISTCVEVS